jgi:hypothetical protein
MDEENKLVGTQKKGRNMLLILAGIFVLPFIMAALLHFLDIRPGGKSFGNLITPPVSLTTPQLNDVHGNVFSPEQWQKKWNIVMIDHHGCDASCQSILDKVNRVHISLAKEAKRVQRILILSSSGSDFRSEIHKKFPNLKVLTGDTEPYVATYEAVASEPSIYLVDPLGDLMMQYPQEIASKELRGDLVRLLKNSWAG